MKIVQPQFRLKSYTCPYCNTLSQHEWSVLYINEREDENYYIDWNENDNDMIAVSTCNCCKNYELWHNNELLKPNLVVLPLPEENMPEDVRELYNEARDVFKISKKAAAALLRLSLQKLCIHLGGDGKNINDDIKKFVKEGLDYRIQKSLDVLRITGNNAVHPGELDLDDNEDITFALFKFMNFIVEKMISEPKEINEFFNSMPEGAKEAIKKRDS